MNRFQFSKGPSTASELDLSKGVTFEAGHYGGSNIGKFVITNVVFYLDTADSTDTSQSVLMDLFQWASTEFELKFEKSSIRRWAFLNNVVFSTDFPLLDYQNPIFSSVGDKIGSAVSAAMGEEVIYRSSAVTFSHDPLLRQNNIADFVIQHRATTSFKENVFWSEAPVSTRLHLELLADIEKDFRINYESREGTIRRPAKAVRANQSSQAAGHKDG
jgi:hypothetical protein